MRIFKNIYEDRAPNSDHILNNDTVASILQILAAIMQLQLAVIYRVSQNYVNT